MKTSTRFFDLHCADVNEFLSQGRIFKSIVTDPPYGINYRSNRQGIDRRENVVKNNNLVVRDRFFEKIQNDKKVPLSWLPLAFESLESDSSIWIFCHWSEWHTWYEAVKSVGFNVKNMVVLNKSNHGMGDLKGQFAPKHELILFAVKGRLELNFQEGRRSDVWDVPVKFSGTRRLHPNEKPVSWYDPCILYSTSEFDFVCDPFMGSGTCGESAVKNNRPFWGCDIDPVNVEVSENRLRSLSVSDSSVGAILSEKNLDLFKQ